MAFPVTARYFINFRKSDTGLTPTFLTFREAVSPFNIVTPPTVTERSDGTYFFDWTWTTAADVDIIFTIDGGASIPTEEVRYVKGVISPRDRFLDVPSSALLTDIKGADDRDLTELAGAGFNTATDSLKVISDNIDTITPSAIANAVWNELITGHQTANSMGRVLNDIFRVLKNRAVINATTKQLEVYDDTGVTVVFTFNLQDENGVASATRIFRRIPL